jgi:predicted Zn finger-like uncharacterized protein
MPITLNCPKCHKPFRVRDESIGGRVRCPSCGAVLQVPATLSPASNFGDGPGESSGPSVERPVAEDVAAGVKGTVHELMLGGPARPEVPGLVPPPGTGMSGPPSIKQRIPTAPPSPLAGRTAPTPAAARTQRAERPRAPEPLGPLPMDAPAWKSVRSGLGLIRCGLFLCSLVLFFAFAHGAWIILDHENAMDEGPGFLKKDGWPKYKELLVAYTVVPLIPAILCLMLGRVRCARAPAEAHARGLACGAAFFTFLGLLGAVIYLGMTYFDLAERIDLAKTGLPAAMHEPIRLTAKYVAIPSAVLAEVLTLLFIGQIGWPLSRPQLQKSVAGFLIFAALTPAALAIGELYYQLFEPVQKARALHGAIFAGQDSDVANRVVIWSVITLTAGVMFFLRYAAVAGSGRRAIRKYVGE